MKEGNKVKICFHKYQNFLDIQRRKLVWLLKYAYGCKGKTIMEIEVGMIKKKEIELFSLYMELKSHWMCLINQIENKSEH